MKKKILALVSIAAFSALSAVAAVGCGDGDTTTPAGTDKGVYYLSVLENGSWTQYGTDSAVPAARKLVQDETDENMYAITVQLDADSNVRIAQVGATATYGYTELLSSQSYLTEGDDNALVAVAGTYTLTFDAAEQLITYTYTTGEEGPPEQGASVLLVEIAGDSTRTLTVTSADAVTVKLTASATLDDSTSTDKNITWESLNTAVATVSSDGLVTAVSAGSAEIVAKSGGKTSDPVTIDVKGTVVLDETDISLSVNGTKTLTATAFGGAQIYQWSVADDTIASVDNGVVTALKAGTTTVRVSYYPVSGGSLTFATCTVTVAVPVTAITLNNNMLSVAAKSTTNLTVGFNPADATNQNYTYEISDGGDEFISVAKTDKTLAVTGINKGSATITVKSEDGNKTAECTVTVVAEGAVTSNISAQKLTLHKSGTNTGVLTVSVAGTTVNSVSWTSGKSSVATVAADSTDQTKATVTGVAFGTTTITATIQTDSGELTQTCTVLVAPDNMWLYGVDGGWYSTAEDAAAKDMLMTASEDGSTFTIEADIAADTQFRIGHDDGFNIETGNNAENYAGIRWDCISDTKKDYTEQGGNTGHGGYNLKINTTGRYRITVVLTGDKPVIEVECLAVSVTGIAAAADNSQLTAGDTNANTATITATVTPNNADYENADIEWTCTAGGDMVDITTNGLTATVVAKDGAAGGPVVIKCTLNGKTATVNLTVVAAGAPVTPVTTINFVKTAYSLNVNGASAWTTTVKADVNSDATNKNITYSIEGDGATVDSATGVVTATKVGTYTVTATAAGDATKTASVQVTFYSDMFYMTGSENGWPDGHPTSTTVGSAFEYFTFTDSGTHKLFTLDVYLAQDSTFMVPFVGGDWANNWDVQVLNGNTATLSGATNDSGNIKVTTAAGLYRITIDLSGAKAAIKAERLGDAPVFTSKLEGGSTAVESGNSTVAKNLYTTNIKTSLATDTEYTFKILSGSTEKGSVTNVDKFSGDAAANFANGTSGFTCSKACTYSLTVTCDGSGNVVSVVVVEVVEYAYKLLINDAEVDGITLIEDSAGQYSLYFSKDVTAWVGLKFTVSTKDSSGSATAQWTSDFTAKGGSIVYANAEGSKTWISKSIAEGWSSIQSSDTGKMYGKIVFTVSGGTITIVSITTADGSLVPSN